MYLDETDPFYRGHSPRKFASELGRWAERKLSKAEQRQQETANLIEMFGRKDASRWAVEGGS